MQEPTPQNRLKLAGVEPLGVNGGTLVVRDARGCLRAFPCTALTGERIRSLATSTGVLRELWPKSKSKGWGVWKAQEEIIAACHRQSSVDGLVDVDRLFTAELILQEWHGVFLREAYAMVGLHEPIALGDQT